MNKRDYILLILILAGGLGLRLYGINWDGGIHMHPDERAIVMYLLPLRFPDSLASFFSPASPLNIHFFAYGNFPLYVLKGLSVLAGFIDPSLASYDRINILGRLISALCDTATGAIIFLIGKKLYNKTVGLFSFFCYSISVLPIQLSHFFAVDTIVTFLMTLCLYLILWYYEKPSMYRAACIGIAAGLGVATKNSALVVFSSISLALASDSLLILLHHRSAELLSTLKALVKITFTHGLIISILTILVFALFEPYAFIDFNAFWSQTLQQSQMTKDAFTFPYTYQFVGKIPYVYESVNIFFWGLGPVLGSFAGAGICLMTVTIFKKEKKGKWAQELILMTFFWIYFLIVGKFAIGFMRYMLPIYPYFALGAGVILYKISSTFYPHLKSLYLDSTGLGILLLMLLIWPVSFLHIYANPNTRILASNWINSTIKPGKTLAIEHWDDGLPISGQQKYHMVTFPLYDPDTPEKWDAINAQLQTTDYIILASDRLYGPLQRLTDCAHLPIYHCYIQTALYYRKLFNGTLGFSKIAEFSQYPTIPILHIPINDQSADESFTVFDHPKIMIFQKNAAIH